MSSSPQVVDWVQNSALPQLVALMTGVVTTVSVLFDLLIGIIIALYILNGKETFLRAGQKDAVQRVFHQRANRIIKRCLYPPCIPAGLVHHRQAHRLAHHRRAVLCWAAHPDGFRADDDGPLVCALISVIIGVTNIIPFFGPFIGAVPKSFHPDHGHQSGAGGIFCALFILALQQFDGNILGPKYWAIPLACRASGSLHRSLCSAACSALWGWRSACRCSPYCIRWRPGGQ